MGAFTSPLSLNERKLNMANTKQKKEPQLKQQTVQEHDNRESVLISKESDLPQYVTVRNGFQGKLVYKSSRTGEKFTWDSFGDEQEIDLRELRNAKSSCKKMFENNWFMFNESDEWVIDYLGVRQYYRTTIHIDDFDSIFKMTPANIKSTVGSMSDGLKKSVAYRARVLIANGEIDSRKSILALEDALGVELIEK